MKKTINKGVLKAILCLTPFLEENLNADSQKNGAIITITKKYRRTSYKE
ncbi:MAG: hypothetical protein H8D38_01970 [DPANN group archaeon]|nr:hypothetical protein [DPANN group archaeon]